MEAPGGDASPAADGPAAIETRGLTRRFGRVAAVAGLGLRVPWGSVYAAKLLVAVAVLLGSTFVLGFGTILGGLALRAAEPAVGLAGPPPWREAVVLGLRVFLIAWLITAIHT